ncbi:MAG: VWA domain-containing protein [Polyangiaceae bacterium]|nr:VWA domain-containing protein [Polyangiaceae bacterium]
MRLSLFGLGFSMLVGGALAVACSSSNNSSEFGNPDGNGVDGGNSGTGGPQFGTDGSDTSTGGNTGDGANCKTVSSDAQLTTVNLVFMLDASGSMGDVNEDKSYLPQNKWFPVTEAIEQFVTTPESAGMNAALTFFPRPAGVKSKNDAAATGDSEYGNANSCQWEDYGDGKADVPLIALPDVSGQFKSKIDQIPNPTTTTDPTGQTVRAPWGDTPTRAAVRGAIDQANKLNQARPTEKAVIVLVTDGEPYCCARANPQQCAWLGQYPASSNYTAEQIITQRQTDQQQEMGTIASDFIGPAHDNDNILTYVIGIGADFSSQADVDNLTTIATAGGTTPMFVSVNSDPTTTSGNLNDQLTKIRGQVISCDFTIPAPPDGRGIDFNKVNVNVTFPGQDPQTFPYDPTCAADNAWHFDNDTAGATPTHVVLCPSTCDNVRTQNASISVGFACTDRNDAR